MGTQSAADHSILECELDVAMSKNVKFSFSLIQVSGLGNNPLIMAATLPDSEHPWLHCESMVYAGLAAL